MAPVDSPPLDSSKRVMGLPAVSLTTVEDDPNVPPVLQLPTQLLVAVQTVRHTTKMSTPTSSLADRSGSSVPLWTDQSLDHFSAGPSSDCGMLNPSVLG
jgi:hypothetical protein